MSSKETKTRVANAYRAMRAIGIKEDKVKPVLMNLVDKNWALIEEENYRVLADAIFERCELEAEKCSKKNANNEAKNYLEEEAQATEEPERPLKRSRQRPQDGQTSSNTSNASMPGTPLVRPKEEPDELSETHLRKLNGPEGIVESPQHNVGKTKTKPQAVSHLAPGSSKGKQPISSKSLVLHDHDSGNPSQSRSNRSQKSTQLSTEYSHTMKLRDRGKGATSLQIPSREKKPVPESSSHAAPRKELKVEQNILPSSKKNKAATRALIKPKDESIIDKMLCSEEPGVIISTAERTATFKESRNNGELKVSSECSSSLEIASSVSGEVKISLSYNLAPGRPLVHAPTLEAVLKSVEDKYLKAAKSLEPKISMTSLMSEICERFLKPGARSSSQSLIMELPPTTNSMSKSSAVNRPQLDKSHASDETVINRENRENFAEEMNDLSLETVQQPPPKITRSLQDVVDIAKGHENVIITLVNEVNDEPPPSFYYIPQNSVFQNAYMNVSLARTGDDNCCGSCSGDCLSSSIPCACSYETGGEYAYTADGLVKEELLNESISMNRNPEKHCQFFCKECPLERSKCEDIIEPCQGHLVRRFIKECWRKCGCNKQCGNRVVQRGITRKLQVCMTKKKGWGLRTLEDLPKGAFVCEYVGEVLTNAELFERVLRSPEGDKRSYPVLLDADWCAEGVLKDEEALCLDATYYGNVARFINHKCHDSNLVEIPVEVETPDHHYYHLAFFTTRKVKAMEELTWDYGIDFDDHEHPIKAFRCQCGSKFCRNIKRRSRGRR
ncbi:hypothetical protein ACS0TY_007271 [Phlomoides rotata]